MPQSESRDNFIPTDHERRVLLELLQSPQESLESIAHELKITLAALTIYLATDDAATLFAQADLANARRARTAAAAQLEKCVGALSLIIDDFISDVTHNLQRETPKSRREQDRQKETARRAATLLYRIASFTPRIITPQLNTSPTRQRGATDAPNAPRAPENPAQPSNLALASRESERAGWLSTSDIPRPTSDINSSPIPPHTPRPVTRRAANHTAASPRDPAVSCSILVTSLNSEPASLSSRAPPTVSAPA
ncbi:MAG TPA: hypothetical protein VF777_03915 [Phycisphaerales bacterium]